MPLKYKSLHKKDILYPVKLRLGKFQNIWSLNLCTQKFYCIYKIWAQSSHIQSCLDKLCKLLYVSLIQEATSPENRSVRPWIVMYGHRPMYCSNTGDDDCTHYGTYTRIGVPFLHWLVNHTESVVCLYVMCWNYSVNSSRDRTCHYRMDFHKTVSASNINP